MAENTATTKMSRMSKLANFRKSFVRFFKDIRSELKKVIWPTRPQLINNTITVLAVCLLIGAIIWIADEALTQLLKVTLVK
jgi:preprotein translocase subunit SecE